MKSIFEKIISGEIIGNILYQNNDFIVLIDIYPKRLGHSLIIPKKKKENILLEEDELIAKMFSLVKKIEVAYREILNAKGYKINFNINKEGNQVIFHTHMHFIPYYENDIHKHEMISDSEKQKLEMKIKELLI